MTKSIETKTAGTLLEEPISVTIGMREYRVPPPSLGTLARIGGLISSMKLQERSEDVKPEEIPFVALREAGSAGVIADILATFITGEKQESVWSSIIPKYFTKHDRVRRRVLATVTPAEASRVFAVMLQSLQLGDFFGLTTFLKGVNILKPTRERKVGKEVTASGQSWREQ